MMTGHSLQTIKHSWPYFVIEGPDGCGKGVVTSALQTSLQESLPHRETLVVTEPTDSHLGRAIRQQLRDEVPRLPETTLQQLFVMDRHGHLGQVINHLQAGKVVLSDRSALSTLVYGSVFAGRDVDFFVDYHREVFGDCFLAPRLTIVLEVDAEVAQSRMARRGEVMEATETRVSQVVEAYNHVTHLAVAAPLLGRVFFIDANDPIGVVTQTVVRTVTDELQQLGLTDGK